MSSGGRIFIVMLVLAFVATGFYYLVVSDDGVAAVETGSVVVEPVVPVETSTPDPVASTVPPAAVDPEPTTVAEAEPVLSTSTVAFRIAVPSRDPVGVDLEELRQKLREQGPGVFRSGIAAWFPVHDAGAFAGDEQSTRALMADPATFFADRLGLVVEPHDGGLQMLLYTLPSKSLVSSRSRAIEVVGVSSGDGFLDVSFSDGTARMVQGLIARNLSRPCATLVGGDVVAVTVMDSERDTMMVTGHFTPEETTIIRSAILGEATLASVPGADTDSKETTEVASATSDPVPAGGTDEPEKGMDDDALVLTTTTTVVTTPPAATSEPRPASSTPMGGMTRYDVKEGDTLTSIAEAFYGSPTSWALIAQANPALDPDALSIGQVLLLPAKGTTPTPVRSGTGSHVVRSGENLSTISEDHYGHARHWKVIYDANRSVIGDDPGALEVGMVLVVPKRTPKAAGGS